MDNTIFMIFIFSPSRAFKCDECECSYFSKGEFLLQNWVFYLIPPASSLGDLVDHKNRCHSNEPANCTICNKVFTSKVALRNHTKRIHAEHTFICTFEACGKKFVNNHLLQVNLIVSGSEILDFSQMCLIFFRNIKKFILDWRITNVNYAEWDITGSEYLLGVWGILMIS